VLAPHFEEPWSVAFLPLMTRCSPPTVVACLSFAMDTSIRIRSQAYRNSRPVGQSRQGLMDIQYREYSKIQNRSHCSYVEPALSVWEAHIDTSILLAKITRALIEDVKAATNFRRRS